MMSGNYDPKDECIISLIKEFDFILNLLVDFWQMSNI